MMKKLMVLALVLGIGSMASAGLVLNVDAAGPITVTVDSGSVMGFDLGIKVEGGTLDATNVNVNPSGKGWQVAAGTVTDTAVEFRWTAADVPMFGGTGLAGPAFLLEGLLLNFDGEATVTLYSYASTIDGADVNGAELASVVVPEPMTLGLLGIGGLFLRRRK